MGIFKAQSTNKTTGLLFYIFEICAAAYFFVAFILCIVGAAQAGSFGLFVEAFLTTIFNTLVLFGLGKIIDLLGTRNND